MQQLATFYTLADVERRLTREDISHWQWLVVMNKWRLDSRADRQRDRQRVEWQPYITSSAASAADQGYRTPWVDRQTGSRK